MSKSPDNKLSAAEQGNPADALRLRYATPPDAADFGVSLLARGLDTCVKLPIMSDPTKEHLEPVWCIVGNVLHERPHGPAGTETRRGTKHFAPGAKVHVVGFFWGMGGEEVTVVGHHRKSHRYITIVIRSRWIANWRAELVYSPYVVREVVAHATYKPDAERSALWPLQENQHWASGDGAKAKAEQIIENLKKWYETANVVQLPTTRPPQPQGTKQAG